MDQRDYYAETIARIRSCRIGRALIRANRIIRPLAFLVLNICAWLAVARWLFGD